MHSIKRKFPTLHRHYQDDWLRFHPESVGERIGYAELSLSPLPPPMNLHIYNIYIYIHVYSGAALLSTKPSDHWLVWVCILLVYIWKESSFISSLWRILYRCINLTVCVMGCKTLFHSFIPGTNIFWVTLIFPHSLICIFISFNLVPN